MREHAMQSVVARLGPSGVEPVTEQHPDDERVTSGLSHYANAEPMLERFVETLPGRIEELRHAVDRCDTDELDRLVRELKRSADGHGYDTISASAGDAARRLTFEPDLEQVFGAIEELADLCSHAVSTPGDAGPDLPTSA